MKKKMSVLAMWSFFSTATDYLKTHMPLNDSLLKAVVIAQQEYYIYAAQKWCD